MSGTQVSSFAPANDLFDLQRVYQGAQQYQQNQQTLGSNEIEMMARASSGLLGLPTEEARAAAYPQAVQQLQQYGFAKNAPSIYPGEATLRRLALLGTSSSKQAEWNYNTTANQASLGPTAPATATTPGTTAATPATGTGTTAAQPVEPDALTRAQAVRDGLIKRGLDPDTATAFASNALHESAARPDTGAGDAGASHGVFQWQGPRYEGYKSVFGNAPDNAPLDQQLDYVMHELNTTESAAREQIAAAKTPEEKAAAISKYYLRPRDVEGEQTRRSATARQLVSQWGGSGQPATTYVGDSLVEPGGVGGQTGRGVRGASPDAVLARLRDTNATSDTQIRGRNIVLSSGASNAPEHAQLLASQLQTLKDRGAGAVTVLGVGPGVKNADTVNAQLKEIAERNGARFVALPADQMGKDGIHPTKEGYAALQAQVQAAPAPAAPGGAQPPASYRVAGAVVAPPAGVPGATVATPQNALAPGVSGAPATAGAVAPVAQNQVGPPVAPAAPAAPAPARPQALDEQNLTADDRRTLAGMVHEDPARFAATKTAMQARNIQQQHQAFEDRRQVAADAAQQAERDYTHGRNTQADVLAAQKAVRDAQAAEDAHAEAVRKAAAAEKEAADPLQGKSEDERIERTLLSIAPKISNKTATPEEEAQYDLLWNKYRDGPIQQVPDGKGGTVSARVPRTVPARFPPPPGQAVAEGPQAIPGTEKPPEMAPPAIVGGMLGNAVGQSKIVRTLANLEAYPGAVGAKANLGDFLLQRGDPEGVQLRADVSDIAGHQFHDLSGAAVSPTEAARLKFIPSEHDTATALKTKLQRLLEINRDTMLQSYRTYGPENGGRRVPAVEEAIVDSIPQPAIDHLRGDTEKGREARFDKIFGKGAAKLVLSNG